MRSSRLLKNIAFYFMGTFSTKLIQFLFIPLYTAYIVTSDFGYFNLTISIISLVMPLLYQSIWEGILRFTIENENNKKRVLSTTNIYCLGITILYSAIFAVVSKLLNIQYGVLILILGLSQMGVAYWQFSARALKENKIYALSTVVNSIITVSLNLFLIIVLKWGLLALFVANTFGNLAMIIVIESKIKLIINTKKADFSFHLLKSILKYSLPLSINALSWWLITSSNNLVISSRIGIDENGIYSMASRFGSILTLVTSVVNMAWLEEAFRTYGDSDKDQYFNRVLNILTRLVLSGVAVLIPITYIFYNFFVFGDYYDGVFLTPIIYLSSAYSTLAAHLGSGFLARKESDKIFKTTLIGGIVSIVGGFALAGSFGIMAVVITSLLGYLIMYFIRVPILKKRMDLKIDFTILMGLTSLNLLTMYISSIKPRDVIYQMFVLILTAFIIIILNRKELFMIIRQIKEKIKRNQ
ncbi:MULTISPECIES: lipopolysaccharide biosynthesis protein [unclassified Sedimentibacter]|uniref:lipopolysaccharide biosynthesis protein n=1 Tax=unclassified Sedimentibacter TaxID=2649220 RepID=UPI0027DFE409|nr:lipopolysaccharide biosynthesis protein [Sedimentibacter sp. MB35-C1]WMJ78085.1 lipopolysaccharide biosynthesis protein [Sedimentibacter sp. MB35-C1]